MTGFTPGCVKLLALLVGAGSPRLITTLTTSLSQPLLTRKMYSNEDEEISPYAVSERVVTFAKNFTHPYTGVCKVLVTVRRDGVSTPEQNLYAGEETSPLRYPRFPNPPQSLIIIEHTPLNIRVSAKLYTPLHRGV